ncbi:MAG: hypothetical protein P8R42_15925 [Candidatus Binatia bacterium]|nr:hypothetical protein [Candidatus Binatia bacterium]
MLSRPLRAWLALRLERNADDEVFCPQFTNQFRDEEPEAVVELLERETARLLARMPVFLQKVRLPGRTGPRADLDVLHESYLQSHEIVKEFFQHAFEFRIEAPGRFVRAIEMQHLLGQLEESTFGVARLALSAESSSPTFAMLRNTLVESVDFMLHTTIDCFDGSNEKDRLIFEAVTSDKGPLIAEMREAHLDDAEHLSRAEQAALLALLIHFEALVNQMHQLGVRRQAAIASGAG